MSFLINADAIFTMYNGDIEEIEFGIFLEYIVKEGIKFLDPMMCGHKDVICLYYKNILICLINKRKFSMVIGTTYHFYCDEDRFKLVIPKFPCWFCSLD